MPECLERYKSFHRARMRVEEDQVWKEFPGDTDGFDPVTRLKNNATGMFENSSGECVNQNALGTEESERRLQLSPF